MGKLIVPWFFVAFIISCTSIEENRKECPCWYTVDFSNVDPQISKLYLWFFDGEGKLLCRDTLFAKEYPKLYEIELKRGIVEFYVWGNVLENTLMESPDTRGACLIKCANGNADPLFGYGKLLNTGGEEGCDVVYLNKEHAVLEIVLKEGIVSESESFEMVLDCGTSGRYADGGFVKGKSSIISQTYADSAGHGAKFRILRQELLSEMKMSLRRIGEIGTWVIEDFPIGKYMEQGGYNMREENLQDLRVELDLSAGEFILETETWRIVMPVEIWL